MNYIIPTTTSINQSNRLCKMAKIHRLADLGDDILRKIFEYDSTYHDLYKTLVETGIWSAAWKNWKMYSDETSCPFVYVAMEWLFQSWGVEKFGDPDYKSAYDIMPPLVFFKQHYFPSDIKIINNTILLGVRDDIAHYVSVYIDGRRVLYCLVMDIDYYEKEYSLVSDDREFVLNNMLELFIDRHNGMVVLI